MKIQIQKIMPYFIIWSLLYSYSFLFMGCQKQPMHNSQFEEDINKVPPQIKNQDLTSSTTEIYPDPQLINAPPDSSFNPATSLNSNIVKNSKLSRSQTTPSRFIQNAFWVIKNEAKKLGTPCNFFVARVLKLSGFSDDPFLANDFDQYANKNFSFFNVKTFSTQSVAQEKFKLQEYLHSFPDRTSFIIQWEQKRGQAGHIAIVEKIADQLVIYQASFNKFIPRRDQTTSEIILSTSQRAILRVYSDFQPK